LPPHTTHKSQPLDSGVFGPLKKAWTEVCHNYQQDNPGAVITKHSFSKLFVMAWSQSFSQISGFRKCGAYPFNRNAIEIIEYDTVTVPQLESTAIPTSLSSQGNPASLDQDSGSQGSQDGTPNDDDTTTTLTEEIVDKFKRRYEEGYNLYVRNGLR